jgi:CheY-like chemotaxis protein
MRAQTGRLGPTNPRRGKNPNSFFTLPGSGLVSSRAMGLRWVVSRLPCPEVTRNAIEWLVKFTILSLSSSQAFYCISKRPNCSAWPKPSRQSAPALPIPRYNRSHLPHGASVYCRQVERVALLAAANLSTSNIPLISVVDDDRSIVESIVSLLESVGYVATGFVSAQDFLNSPQLRRTACLILDVRMPGMGGLELQRRLAAENVHTPIIFITAHGDQEVSAEVLSSGGTALLRKPFSQESLLGALRSALASPQGPTGHAKPN